MKSLCWYLNVDDNGNTCFSLYGLITTFCVSDQGNLQGPKGLKAKRSREYFEVKHLGVEKKKRGRKRKSEYLLPGDPNNVATRTLVENGLSIVGASFNVAQGQKISSATTTATTTILPVQNVTVTSQTPGTAVVIPQGVSPGVSTSTVTVGNVQFQVPGNVTMPHPSPSTVKSVPLLVPQGKVPLAHPQRGPVPINALPGGKPVMKEVKVMFFSLACLYQPLQCRFFSCVLVYFLDYCDCEYTKIPCMNCG